MENEKRIEKWREERQEVARKNKEERLKRSVAENAERKKDAVTARMNQVKQEEEKKRVVAESFLPTPDNIAEQLASAENRRRLRTSSRIKSAVAFGLAPLALVLLYQFLLSKSFYQTESTFSISSIQDNQMQPTGGLLGISGSGSGLSDGYKVREYLLSSEVMNLMESKHGFMKHFGNSSIDPFSRPITFSPLGIDHLDFYNKRVSISVDQQEGLLKLRVQANTPKDTVRFANLLLGLGRDKVAKIYTRLNDDQLADLLRAKTEVEDKLALANARVQEVQLTRSDIDPAQTASGIYAIISGLEVELAEQEAQRSALLRNDLNRSPFLPRLNARISALKQQLSKQKARLVDPSSRTSVQRSLANYDAAVAERKIAETELESLLRTIEQAQLRTLEQRRYLIVIAKPIYPTSSYNSAFFSVLLLLFVLLTIGLVASAISSRLR